MAAPNPKRMKPHRTSPEAMAPAKGMEVPDDMTRAEEDFLDMQENLARDPRASRRLNVYLVTAYLLMIFLLLVAGALVVFHATHR